MEAEHTKPIYNDEDAARAHLEGLLWPHGPVCPSCGVVDDAVKMAGESHRKGLYNCRSCRTPFTVTVGTVFESSHIPLHKWVYGMHLMAASKKGISALQLQRQLGLGSYRTAWFMAHRIREALRPTDTAPIGGEGQIVEADETYYGKLDSQKGQKPEPYVRSKHTNKKNVRPIVALVERGGHLSRYVDEFSFRHNTRAKLGFNDQDRAALAIQGAAGKRLTYRRTGVSQAAYA